MSKTILSKYLILILLLLAVGSALNGQARKPLSKNNLTAELKLQYGFLMSHHLELDIFQSHFPAFEFSIQKVTWGKERWEAIYGYPIIGLSVWYSPLGGFKEIGSAFAVYPFINFPIVQDQYQSLNFRLGLGLGYLTNHFDRIDNYKNFAIGSTINVAGSLFAEYRRKISKMASISVGFGLTHFSNGSTKTPNYGLNLLTATFGFSSYLSRPNPSLSKKVIPKLYTFEFDGKKSLDLDVSYSMGVKDMKQQFGKSFLVYALAANLLKQVSWKSKFGIGLDLTYDASDKFIMEWNGDSVESYQLIKPGLSAVYQLVISRLSFVFNLGVYLHNLEKSEGDIYQRLTLRYLFTNEFFASLALHTHWGKADYIGFGIGYQFDFIYKRTVKH